MPRLKDLRKDILAMSEDELRDKLRQIREDRKLKKEPARARKARVQKADKAKTSINKLLAGLSAEELAAIIGEMEQS